MFPNLLQLESIFLYILELRIVSCELFTNL
jgi:hypothetical protein